MAVNNSADNGAAPPWGTWEELLLACAVNRYGSNSWGSVADEIQKRSSALCPLSPHDCKRKYKDLKRRFMAPNDDVSEGTAAAADGGATATNAVPWLDELRKLRVAELRREVERHDLSIVSLQSRLNRLKEEHDQSLRVDLDREKPDRETITDENGVEKEKKHGNVQPEILPESDPAGEGFDRDDQSVSESNSSYPRSADPVTEMVVEKPFPEETSAGVGDPGETGKRAFQDSCNGSAGSTVKVSAAKLEKQEAEGGPGESRDLCESVAESKEQVEVSSKASDGDEQSSASLCKKTEVPQSLAAKAAEGIAFELNPLMEILQMIKSHMHGSIFAHRLESQETTGYMSLIRQHMDLEMVEARLEEGYYENCSSKFFRDLLLLFNNAIVFFDNKSSESIAAIEFRQVVSKEMAQRIFKLDSSHGKQQPSSQSDPEPSDPLPGKPSIPGPIIACRKRSSVAARASASSSAMTQKKREKTETMMTEKADLDSKQPDDSSTADAEEPTRVTKRRSKERFIKSSKSRTNASTNKAKTVGLIKGRSSSENREPSTKKIDTPLSAAATAANSRKQSASSRRKQSSSSDNVSLLEALKSVVFNSRNTRGKVQENKRNGSSKGNEKRREMKNSGEEQTKERVSLGKRTGRSTKQAAAAEPPPTPVVPARRSRESAGKEAATPRRPKKRSRRW